MSAKTYDASSFDSLNELESIRYNVPMYAGSSGIKGIGKLFGEVIENSRDEATPCYNLYKDGYRTKDKLTVNIEFFPDGSVSIEDDGRGLPVDVNQKTGQRACYLAFEKKHAGGKLKSMAGTTYGDSIGVHGVGLTLVNACSKWVNVVIKRDGKIYELKYKNGGSEREDVKVIGECPIDETGTMIHFLYDNEVVNPIHDERGMLDYPFIIEEVINYITDLVIYSEHFEAHVKWNTGEVEYDSEGNELRKDTERGKVGEKHIDQETFSIKNLVLVHTPNEKVYEYTEDNPDEDYRIKMIYSFTDSFGDRMTLSTVNSLKMIFGSSFEKAFEDEVYKYFENILKTSKKLKDGFELTRNQVVNKLNYVISLNTTKRDFANQAKNSYSNDRITMVLRDTFKKLLGDLPSEDVADVVNNILFEYNENIAQVERYEQERAKKLPRKNMRDIQQAMSKKFRDCENGKGLKNVNRVWFLEGDSAGNGFAAGRDPKRDAYVMLKGKPLNVIRNSIKRVRYEGKKRELYDYEQFTLIRSVVEKDKFNTYIILTDADVDGLHIRNLLIYLFYKYFPDIVQRGQLYIAEAPLYRMKKGNKIAYVFYEDEKESYEDEGYSMDRRYKGLGEMENGELYKVLMDYNKFIQLSMDDARIPIEIDGDVLGMDDVDVTSEQIIRAIAGKDASFRRYIAKEFMSDNLKNYLEHKNETKKKFASKMNPLYLNDDGTPMTQYDIDLIEAEKLRMEFEEEFEEDFDYSDEELD